MPSSAIISSIAFTAISFEIGQGLLIDGPLQTVGPLAPRMIGNLEHLLEVLGRWQGGDPLACTGRTARTAVGFG